MGRAVGPLGLAIVLARLSDLYDGLRYVADHSEEVCSAAVASDAAVYGLSFRSCQRRSDQ